METLLVLTCLPDQVAAESLAASLVENRFAACVNILQPCHSVYRWKGAVEKADEVPLLIKTTEACYPALEAAIRAAHPYATPEIIALPVVLGLPDYLAWVAAETQIENWSSP
ncbi:divalent-cation tolerance protein CutA [bacterium]|jgi:periplasmic divalent cation tolerance protein|nr:divalent-cation tolerance protein CutA [bacterium]